MGKWLNKGVWVGDHMEYPKEADLGKFGNGHRYFPYSHPDGTVQYYPVDEGEEESIEESHSRQKEPEETDWSSLMEGSMGNIANPDGTDYEHRRQKEPEVMNLQF